MKKSLVLVCLTIVLLAFYTDAAYPDLSKISFSLTKIDNMTFVSLNHSMNADNVEVSCGNCNRTGDNGETIPCLSDMLEMNIRILTDGRTYDIPVNVSCQTGQNEGIDGFKTTFIGVNNVFVSWQKGVEIDHYHLVLMGERTRHYVTADTHSNTFNISGLRECTAHQICISSVDKMWLTSRYACLAFDTDFTTTGPVENATATARSDTTIIVSWKEPRYRLDRPTGYYVFIRDNPGIVFRLYVISVDGGVPNLDVAGRYKTIKLQWKELQSLTVDELSPYSEYVVIIRPINRGRNASVIEIPVRTEEGESGPVNVLKIEHYTHRHFHVSFKSPDLPNGVIRKYRIRIYLVKNGTCLQEVQQLLQETNRTGTNEWIYVQKAEQCRTYRVDIAAINGWRGNDGVGRLASVEHTEQSLSTMFISRKFLTTNLLRLSWQHGTSLCANSVMIVRVKNAVGGLSCVDYVSRENRCEGIKQAIPSDGRCSIVEKTEPHLFSKGALLIPLNGTVESHLVSVWMFLDTLRTVMETTNLTAPASSDCFTDCSNGGYDGIRSATKTGGKCSPWMHSPWRSNFSNAKSNFCRKINNEFRCPVDDNQEKWDYCDVPECSSLTTATGCVTDTHLSITSSSVSVTWSKPPYADTSVGYAVLLHDTDNVCKQYAVQTCTTCGNETSLSTATKSFYASCEKKIVKLINGNALEFTNLHEDTSYFVYIIAFVDKSNGGDVKRLSVKTKITERKSGTAFVLPFIFFSIYMAVALVFVWTFRTRSYRLCGRSKRESVYLEDFPNTDVSGTASVMMPGSSSSDDLDVFYLHPPKVQEFPKSYDGVIRNFQEVGEQQFRDIENLSQQRERGRLLVFYEGDQRKDRYKDIRPYRHTRVKLSTPNDYINANKVCPKHCGLDSDPLCSCKEFYIATQGPLKKTINQHETISDFWRMAFENNVDVIVNLTRCVEDNKRKSSQYWPKTVGEKLILKSCDETMTVEMKSCSNFNGIYEERVFKVTMNSVTKAFTQLHFFSWVDHGNPPASDFICLHRRFVSLKQKDYATIVHGSAGVGRTGTFILVDDIVRSIKSPNDRVDVYNTLVELRKCRQNMVQTKAQYIFVYSVLYRYLLEEGLIQKKWAFNRAVQTDL